jgi:PAS domain S-box-containing protein
MRTTDSPQADEPDLNQARPRRRSMRGVTPLLPRHSTLVACAIVGLAYSAAGAVGVWLLQHILTPALAGFANDVGMPWLPAGIGVAGLMLFGVRAWPGVFAGSCVTWGLVQHDTWGMVVLGAASESLSIVLIAWLLSTWDYRASLERYRDALLLIAAAAIGRIVTSGTDVIGLIAAVWLKAPSSPLILDEAGIHRSGDVLLITPALLLYALRWWANTAAGVVLVVPLLAYLRSAGRRSMSGKLHELAAWGLSALGWVAGTLIVRGAEPRLPLIAGALALVIWAAVRFGVAVAATGSLVFSMTAAAGFGLQLGTFAGIEGREGTAVAWGFIGVLSGTALFLTSLLSQRELTRRAIAASAERYRRLFLSNPYPMWAEDLATGRMLLVNPAALGEYGYDEAAFLGLRGEDLLAGPMSNHAAQAPQRGPTVTTERHRTSLGAEIDVEVTRVAVDFGGRPARVCFVEPMSERNAMRLAALGAADLERFRLGGTIATQLMPRLSRVANGAHQLALAHGQDPAVAEAILTELDNDVTSAILVCKGVTRGVSPLLSADGDLAESLRQMASSLPGVAAQVNVSIHSVAPVALSIERRDHIYRLVEDAVRVAAARPGVTQVSVALEAAPDNVRVLVEDDGAPGTEASPADELARRSMAARAAAASGHLRIASRPSGGTIVRFECEPEGTPGAGRAAHAARREGPSVAEAVVAAPAREPTPAAGVPATAAPGVRPLWGTVLLALAYTAAAGVGLAFIRAIDALNVSYRPVHALPWLAGGVAVVGLLLGGLRLWPAIVVGYIAIWWGVADEGWLMVVLAAAAQALSVLATVQILRHFGFRRSFDRLQDFLLLVAAAALGRALVVPADLLGLQLANAVSPLTAGPEMREVVAPAQAILLGLTVAKLQAVARWWLNGVAGVVLVVPALLSWTRPLRDVVRRQRAELLLATLALAAAVATLLFVGTPGWRLPILALSLAVVTWAAVRFGTGPASTATLVLSLAAAASFGFATGALAPTGPDEGLSMLWGFIVLLAAAAQVLTALLAGSDRADRQLHELDRQYRELFEAVPHAVFAFAASDHRIRVANAATAVCFGLSTGKLVHSSAATLCPDPRLLLPLRRDAAAERIEVTVDTRREERIDLAMTRVAIDLDDGPGILCFAIDVSERNRLRTRVIEATDLERRNLAREFHDGLGQILTGLHLGVASLRRASAHGRSQRASGIEFVASAADEALRTCTQILRGVSPLQGTDGDLVDAIRRMPGRLPPDAKVRLAASIDATAPVTLPLASRVHVYQIAQEAVTNCLKHASATEVSVRLVVRPGEVEIEVTDDGIGFEAAGPSEGLGLESIRMRAVALRGSLTIEARGRRGTALCCVCPQPVAGAARADVAPDAPVQHWRASS